MRPIHAKANRWSTPGATGRACPPCPGHPAQRVGNKIVRGDRVWGVSPRCDGRHGRTSARPARSHSVHQAVRGAQVWKAFSRRWVDGDLGVWPVSLGGGAGDRGRVRGTATMGLGGIAWRGPGKPTRMPLGRQLARFGVSPNTWRSPQTGADAPCLRRSLPRPWAQPITVQAWDAEGFTRLARMSTGTMAIAWARGWMVGRAVPPFSRSARPLQASGR